MVLIKKVNALKGLFLAAGQILGAVAASIVVKVAFPGEYVIQTKLGHGANAFQGLLIEALLTMQLLLAIFFMAVEKHDSNSIAALVIGFALFVAEYVVPVPGKRENCRRDCALTVLFFGIGFRVFTTPVVRSTRPGRLARI